MNHGLSIVLAFLAALVMAGCGGRADRTMSSAEEEELLMRVAEPSAAGDFSRAIAVADSLLATELSDSARTYVMSERCVALGNSGHLDATIAYADTVLRFAREKGVDEIVMNMEGTLGFAWRRKENYDSAIVHLQRGLAFAEKVKNKEYEQYFTELVGIAMADRHRPDEAEMYLRRSVQLAREMDDTAYVVSAVSQLGSLLTRDERGDSTDLKERNRRAIDYLKPYIPLAEAVDPITRFKFITPLAFAYMNIDSAETAHYWLERARGIANSVPEMKQYQFTMLLLDERMAEKEHRPADRLALLYRLDSAGMYRTMSHEVSLNMAQSLAALGRYREAYAKAETAYGQLRKAHDDDVQEQMAEMSAKYNAALKDLEIERLTNRGWVMTLVIVGLVFAGVVATILLIFTARARKRREELARQREYIRGLEQERTRIARELHDDIAGDLVGLQFVIRTIGPESASDRIGKIARKTRALSHELISPEFSRHTLPELIRNLSHSRTPGTGLEIVTGQNGTFDWASLSPDESLELYRIVQEAVNNAVKYASRDLPLQILMGGDDKYEITVTCGLGDAAHDSAGIGHSIMRTRAQIAGATLAEESDDTNLTLTIKQK